MKKSFKVIVTLLMLVALLLTAAITVFAAGETDETADASVVEAVEAEEGALGDKAMAAAVAVGLAAAAGALGMGWAIAKSVEGISRQPEAEGKIRTTLMLGLVFVETAIIYALVIAILIIFVL